MKKNYQILIVDDDPIIGENLRDIFEEIGNYTVVLAPDPFEGLNILKRSYFDIVFTDMLMPKMDGLEFLKNIKLMDQLIPVVMITGFPTVDIAIQAMKEGASDFITKPFKFSQIKIIAEKLLKERQLISENLQLKDQLKQKRTIETLNENLNKKIKEISILYSISESFSGSYADNEIHEVYNRIVDMAVEITGCCLSILLLLDRNKNELIPCASVGIDHNKAAIPITLDYFGVRDALQKKTPFLSNNSCHFRTTESGNTFKLPAFESYALIPLMIKDEVFGILFVAHEVKSNKLSDNDLLLLQNLIKKASLNIENRLLYESIFDNLKSTLHSLVAAIEARDKYTLTHSIRVTEYAVTIAKSMGCSQDEVDILISAGHLHDIGKIGVSDTILLKSEGLTEKEFEIVKQHPEIGENILKPLGFLPRERDVIRYHHEKWDGSGYPDGLRGEQIPFLSRIIAVADSYDAMTTDRPYRKALGRQQALNELKRKSDQFDQNIVDIFMQIVTGEITSKK